MFVVMECDGRMVRWDDGVLSGDPELVAEAYATVHSDEPVPVFGAKVIPNLGDPVGAVAAVFAATDGYASWVTDCSDDVAHRLHVALAPNGADSAA